MRVLAISGSPLERGNTARLINSIIEELEKREIPDLNTRTISLADVDIRPCRACKKCMKTGYCVLKKDDFAYIAKKMLKADLILLGSPVYFHDVSGRVKNLIDRSLSLWHERKLKGKKFIPVAVAAESGDDRTIETLNIWAQAHEMKIMRSVSGHADRSGDILKDEKAMNEASEAARTINGDQ